GSFTSHQIHPDDHDTMSSFVADLDQDGDLDLVEGTVFGTKYWYENDGSESFTAHSISAGGNLKYIRVADLDQDGDLDIIQGNSNQPNYWYENGCY
ncbi:MAG: VCBS repeat-containing protein, partial [archaeon]